MMRFGTKVFYTDRYDQQRFAGEPVTEAAGTVSLPRWRVQTNVGATLGDIDLDVHLLWRDKTQLSLLPTIEDTPVNEDGAYTQVKVTEGLNDPDRFRLPFNLT